jgi:polyisoprenoid-binding protein YceI
MNKKLLTIFFVLGSFSSIALADTYEIDPAHSRVGFKVRHMAIANVLGNFAEFKGNFTFDPKAVAKSTATALIKTSSVDTHNEKRDTHLKDKDFFASSEFPEIKFETEKVIPKKDGEFDLAGNLTIKDVTKPVIMAVSYQGSVKDPMGNTRAGFTATTAINRKDFGLKWNKVLEAGGVAVGDEVKIELEIEGIKKS